MSNNENLSKNELILKLKEIYASYINALNIKLKMDNFEPEDKYYRDVLVPMFPGRKEIRSYENKFRHESSNAVEMMSELYKSYYCPKKPSEPQFSSFIEPHDVNLNNKKSWSNLFSKTAMVVGILFVWGTLVNIFEQSFSLYQLPFTIISLSIFCFLFFFFKKKSEAAKLQIQNNYNAALDAYNQDKNEKLQQYELAVKNFEKEYQIYEADYKDFVDEYSDWRKIYIQHLEEEAEIEEKLENDRIVAVNKISEEEYIPALEKLADCNDLVSEEYLPALETIIELLRTNRADNLKEAINLYEEIVYRERQLQLQREQEEQRQYEEELRRQDEERRYQEEKRFREEQERNRQQEERDRQRQEERRYQEEKEFREKQERNRQYEENRRREEDRRREAKAELDRKSREDSATRRQCNACALASRCSVAFTRPNCASYRPR